MPKRNTGDHNKSLKRQRNRTVLQDDQRRISEAPTIFSMQKPHTKFATESNEMMDSINSKDDRFKGPQLKQSTSNDSSSSDDTDRSSAANLSSKRNADQDMTEDQHSRVPLSEVGPYDVLSGRDKAVFNYVGNRRFRVSLALWIPRYEEAKTKSQKAAVIGSLCKMLKYEAGVRFLKRMEGRPGEEDYYVELNSTQTKKKVGHAIRDMAVARKEVSQRRLSALKTKRMGKKRRHESDEDSCCSDDNTSIDSDEQTDSNLRDSLSALLPFVANDPHDEAETSMEPLPFAGRTHDSNGSSVFVPQAATSMGQPLHNSTMLDTHGSELSAPMALPIPPPPHPEQLPSSNTFPGPQPYYYANHFHYHYHRYPQHHREEGSMQPTSLHEPLQYLNQAYLQSHRPSLHINRNESAEDTKVASFKLS
ncbi:hypothetical protein IV203_032660 [Nitzschia inconspicua]|uniref:DUF6824 domain-containing protein n=1 Tax=Nitzschia inconspicua TaxID=303405 RepID=A0A9K3KL70_9STRA|nr:hypothetical protein IV203_032660 [Nitzschia inconspicua]